MDVVLVAISVGISLVALVVSIVAYRRQTAIQERVAAIEEARRAEEVEARGRERVTASLVHEGGRLQFVLRNEGQAVARSVQVELAQGPQMPVIGLDALPVDLQPGQPMPFLVVPGLGDAMTYQVTVRWTDEAGGHKEPFTLSRL